MCFEEWCQENVKKRFRDAEHTCPPSALLFLLCAPHLSLRLEKKKNNPACKKKQQKNEKKTTQKALRTNPCWARLSIKTPPVRLNERMIF